MLYTELLAEISRDFAALPDKPEETPESTAAALWRWAAGVPCSAVRALQIPLPDASSIKPQVLADGLTKWSQGIPLGHIVERQDFCGLELKVGSQALIPRKETELLATVAAGLIERCGAANPLVIDVCTGCGNLPLYYASRFPDAKVFAADLSADAVALAQENARQLKLERVGFRAGDLLEPFNEAAFRGCVDVLSCNPPYISSKRVAAMPEEIAQYEPSMAFDGGPFGISILQRFIDGAPGYLHIGGSMAFEIGLGQGPSLLKRLGNNPLYADIQGHVDARGDVRVISARLVANA